MLIKSWNSNAFCYSFGRIYILQNIQKLLLGGKENGMFIWDRLLVKSLGFFMCQKLSMFHMVALLYCDS